MSRRLAVLLVGTAMAVMMLAIAGMAWATECPPDLFNCNPDDENPPPPPPGGDTTPPTVVSTVPTDGKTRVDRDKNIKVTFSEAMDADSIEFNVVLNRGNLTYAQLNPSGYSCSNPPAPVGTSVAAKVTYNATTNSATLNPSRRLAKRASYTVEVDGAGDYADSCFLSAVEDLAGNPMANDHIWHFRTGRR